MSDITENNGSRDSRKGRRNSSSSLAKIICIVIVAVLAVAGAVFLTGLFSDNDKDTEADASSSGAAPAAANTSGGIALTDSTVFAEGDDLGAVDPTDVPARGTQLDRIDEDIPHVVIYTDPNCPECAETPDEMQTSIREGLEREKLTAEYRLVSFHNGASLSDQSTRANNAMVCMAEEEPEEFLGYLNTVVGHAHSETSNEEFADIAEDEHGVDIRSCIEDGTYHNFTEYTTREALENGVQNVPMVYVDGDEWDAQGDTLLRDAVDERS